MADFTRKQIDALAEFASIPSPSGAEAEGALWLGRRIKEATGVQPYIDVHGNLHAVVDRGAKRTVLIEGHCDEIGFIVQWIDDDGFLYLSAVGGVTVPAVASERITIEGRSGRVNGVMGVRPPHLLSAKERDSVAPKELSAIACDIGASSREEAESLVSVGALAVVDAGYRPLAGSRVSCRGFDNRIGAFAMCEAFIDIANSPCGTGCNVHFAATVQEETGLVGGQTVAFDANPDIGICCDVTFASDAAKQDRKLVGDLRLGAGPVIACGPAYHRGLFARLRETAEASAIPYQVRACARASGNNGWAMRLQRGGAATAVVAVPLRYMHSPVEVIDLRDAANAAALVASAVKSLDDSFPLLPEQP